MRKSEAQKVLNDIAAVISDYTFETPVFEALKMGRKNTAWYTEAEVTGVYVRVIIDDKFTFIVENCENARTYHTKNIVAELRAAFEE